MADQDLPIHLRAAIDAVVILGTERPGPVRGTAIGHPRLVAELGRYGLIGMTDGQLFALGAGGASLRREVERHRPARVVVMVPGMLDRPLRRLRVASFDLPAGLPVAAWSALGYEPVVALGVQGCGWLCWATADRAWRRLGRPDLADRCRIAMLRTLIAARGFDRLSSVVVKRYERCS